MQMHFAAAPFFVSGNGEWEMGNGRARISAPFVLQLCAVRRAVCALSGACRRHYVVSLALLARRLRRHKTCSSRSDT